MSTFIIYVQLMAGVILGYTTDFEDMVVKASGHGVQIKWKSTIDMSSQYFEVQRTGTNNNFKTIALIMTIEDLENKKSFNYTDEISNNPPSVVKYRIKKVSLNNHIVYSPVLECDLSKETKDL